MFKECKRVCDFLIVALHTDPSIERKDKNKPILSVAERIEILEAVRHIDKLVLYDTEAELVELLKELKPDIRIIGADWKNKPYTGHELPIKVYFNSRDHQYSSSELRKRIYEAENQKNK